jgi:hypothetical protein
MLSKGGAFSLEEKFLGIGIFITNVKKSLRLVSKTCVFHFGAGGFFGSDGSCLVSTFSTGFSHI